MLSWVWAWWLGQEKKDGSGGGTLARKTPHADPDAYLATLTSNTHCSLSDGVTDHDCPLEDAIAFLSITQVRYIRFVYASPARVAALRPVIHYIIDHYIPRRTGGNSDARPLIIEIDSMTAAQIDLDALASQMATSNCILKLRAAVVQLSSTDFVTCRNFPQKSPHATRCQWTSEWKNNKPPCATWYFEPTPLFSPM